MEWNHTVWYLPYFKPYFFNQSTVIYGLLWNLEKRKTMPITIDLTGPQGNANFLLGLAKKLAKQLNLDEEKIVKEMKSGDYEHLLSVFDKYFTGLVKFVDQEF